MKADQRAEDVAVAEDYYDSDDADRFYFTIWGGEDIHVGMYKTPDEAIAPASHRTVETMAEMMGEAGKAASIIDLGAGYGGSARFLAKDAGAKTIIVTNFSSSPLQAYADVKLFTMARETKFRTEAMTSRIAQLCVLDALIAALALADYDRATDTLRKTFDVLSLKRF